MEMMETQILRIKRRRRDEHETLDALGTIQGHDSGDVIQAPPRPAKRSKKDSDGSQDALNTGNSGVPSSNNGIFRFAATVSPSTFTTEASKRSLRDRITSLILHPPPRGSSIPHSSSANTPSSSQRQSKFSLVDDNNRNSSSSPASATLLQRHEKARKQARYRIVQEKRSYPASPIAAEASSSKRRTSPRRPTAPPIVRSTATTATANAGNSTTAEKEEFRILEAAIESDSDNNEEDVEADNDPIRKQMQAYARSQRASGSSSRTTSNKKLQVNRYGSNDGKGMQKNRQQQKDDDDMMSNFVPMLQEYLSLSTPSTSAPVAPTVSASSSLHHPSTALPPSFHSPAFSTSLRKTPSHSLPPSQPPSIPLGDDQEKDTSSSSAQQYYPPDLSSGDAGDSDSEYVYDVYYRDSAIPSMASSSTATTGAGTGAGELSSTTSYLDQTDINPYANEGLGRIGALTGLEDDELLYISTGGKLANGKGGKNESDESEDEGGNTDDEDSNEEDFYRNDYPEGEGGSDDSGDHDQRMYTRRRGGFGDDEDDEDEGDGDDDEY